MLFFFFRFCRVNLLFNNLTLSGVSLLMKFYSLKGNGLVESLLEVFLKVFIYENMKVNDILNAVSSGEMLCICYSFTKALMIISKVL